MANLCAVLAVIVSAFIVLQSQSEAGLIKDIFQKVTHTNNKTESTVRESAPICGNSLFSTPNEGDLSPEIIFITSKRSKARPVYDDSARGRQRAFKLDEVAKEFRFHPENVTLEELERNGFNADAPVSFLMHGFTSGYPLQAWISAIVEAYTIDRETAESDLSDQPAVYGGESDGRESYENYGSQSGRRREQGRNKRDTGESGRRSSSSSSSTNSDRGRNGQSDRRARPVAHNLFIINWNYAARGMVYPRAVANIPIVASYVTRFMNDRLIDEAHVDPKRIQLVGHSLGAHLAGFIGKNTRSKVGRIYGLDPAGPCFGTISGPLYPASKRLAPGDAHEVITIQTNSALLGHEKPLGRYSVYVEGGADQPGCKASGVLKSLSSLSWDGADFDSVSCSHSRAPNLITYRQDQRDSDENCLMVAYACKDWQSFLDGHCGVCQGGASSQFEERKFNKNRKSPLEPVHCLRVGLDWQYPAESQRRPHKEPSLGRNQSEEYDTNTRRPYFFRSDFSSSRRPFSSSQPSGSNSEDRYRRAAKMDDERESSAHATSSSTSRPNNDRRREEDREEVEPVRMFLRTSDTQPYCAFHYQVVLELNEPFPDDEPAMSLILQDDQPDRERRRGSSGSRNSLSSDDFGQKFDENTYTDLLTSYRKLRQIDHGTLIVRDGLKDGHRRLKALHVNYMSNPDPAVNRRLSTRLCPVKTNTDRAAISGEGANRFYFEPCERQELHFSESHHSNGSSSHSHRDRN